MFCCAHVTDPGACESLCHVSLSGSPFSSAVTWTLCRNIITLLYPVCSDCFQQVNRLDDVLHTSLVEHIGFISVTCMSVITNVRNVWFIDAQSHRNQSRERWEDKLESCFLFFVILLMHRWLPQIEGRFQKHLSRLVIAAFERALFTLTIVWMKMCQSAGANRIKRVKCRLSGSRNSAMR